MKKLDKFILTSFIGPFFLILLVVIFILMMQFLWVYIDELVGKGLGFKVIAEFLFWGGCTVLPLALPLATLLASMMTIGSMGENNELIALKSAGVSVLRVMMPLMIAAFFISIGTFFVINKLVPVSYNEIFTLRDDIGKTKDEIKVPSGTFYDGVDGYVLRVGSQNSDGMMRDVMLYDHTGRGNTRLTIADSAVMKMSKDKDYITIKMYNGTNYQETNTKNYRDTSLQLQMIDFSKQEMVIALENYAFQKSDSARFGDQVKALPLARLREDRDSLEAKRDSTKTEQLMSTAAAYIFLLHSQLDTAASGISRNFKDPDYLKFRDDQMKADAIQGAANMAMQMQANLENYEFGAFDYTVRLRWTLVEFLRRYGQALACFIMFFIGAPLGALIRKGGLGVSAIVSILFFVLYWIVDITVTKLARDGSVGAVVGAFGAPAVMLPIGIYLTIKAIHDTDLSNLDSIKNWWRRFKSKVAGLFKKTRIVYMGTPEFAVAPLKALLEQTDYNIAAVVTVPDKASGRGLQLHESAVKKFAVEHGIPVLQPEKLKDPDFLAKLKSYDPDMFIVVAFRMLPKEVWSMPRMGTFNLHASILPQYRGAAPINWAIINGERQTGVTTFMIDEKIDTGGILYNDFCPIEDYDNAGSLHDKLAEKGSALVVKTATALVRKKVSPAPQVAFSELKPAPKITRETCQIDLGEEASTVCLLVRGLSPYPGAHLNLVAEDGSVTDVKVYDAFVPAREEQLSRGQIATDGKTYLSVGCASGNIRIMDIQLAGKKRLKIEEFLKGFRDASKYHFE